MIQLFKEKDLIGKTIRKVHNSGREFWIRFWDDSFVVMEINEYSEGFGYSINKIQISESKAENNDEELVELGLITQKEYEDAVEEEKRKWELNRQKREREQQEEQEERERQLFEQLKKKFEND